MSTHDIPIFKTAGYNMCILFNKFIDQFMKKLSGFGLTFLLLAGLVMTAPNLVSAQAVSTQNMTTIRISAPEGNAPGFAFTYPLTNTLKAGTRYTIKWQGNLPVNPYSETQDINVVKAGSSDKIVTLDGGSYVGKVLSSGKSFDWTVPTSLKTGSYQLVIGSNTEYGKRYFSMPFKITNTNLSTIVLVKPAINETYVEGTTYKITWKGNNLPSNAKVSIAIWDQSQDGRNKTIVQNVPASAGYYEWKADVSSPEGWGFGVNSTLKKIANFFGVKIAEAEGNKYKIYAGANWGDFEKNAGDYGSVSDPNGHVVYVNPIGLSDYVKVSTFKKSDGSVNVYALFDRTKFKPKSVWIKDVCPEGVSAFGGDSSRPESSRGELCNSNILMIEDKSKDPTLQSMIGSYQQTYTFKNSKKDYQPVKFEVRFDTPWASSPVVGSTVIQIPPKSAPQSQDPSIKFLQAKASENDVIYSDESAVLFGDNLGTSTVVIINGKGLGKEGGDILKVLKSSDQLGAQITIYGLASGETPDGYYDLYVTRFGKKSNAIKVKYVNHPLPVSAPGKPVFDAATPIVNTMTDSSGNTSNVVASFPFRVRAEGGTVKMPTANDFTVKFGTSTLIIPTTSITVVTIPNKDIAEGSTANVTVTASISGASFPQSGLYKAVISSTLSPSVSVLTDAVSVTRPQPVVAVSSFKISPAISPLGSNTATLSSIDTVTASTLLFNANSIGAEYKITSVTVSTVGSENITTQYLYDGSSLVKNKTAGPTVVFDNLSIIVPKDITKTLKLMADYPAQSASSAAKTFSVNTSVTSVTYEGPDGKPVTINSQVNGVNQYAKLPTANDGNAIYQIATEPTIYTVNQVVAGIGQPAMTASFSFSVGAAGGNVKRPTNSDFLVKFSNGVGSVATATAVSVVLIPNVDYISDGSTASITVTATVYDQNIPVSGLYQASITSPLFKGEFKTRNSTQFSKDIKTTMKSKTETKKPANYSNSFFSNAKASVLDLLDTIFGWFK